MEKYLVLTEKCLIFFSSDMTFQSIGIFIYHPTL